MADYAQSVEIGKQLQDGERVSLLAPRELTALVGNWVVDPVVIGLSEDRLDSLLTGVVRTERLPDRKRVRRGRS